MNHEKSADGSGDGYFLQFLNRTVRMIGREAVDTLRTRRVAIAGCGGVGGAACITLARMGVGRFTLADPGLFDEPDINRQWAANGGTLGKNKTAVHEEILHTINPDVEVRSFSDGVTEENIEAFLDGADLVVDCLDIAVPGHLRSGMSRRAWERGMYCISAPTLGFGGFVITASPK
ncbi:MAG: hypothetical protein C0404_12025, partial [Verrucomicrobia bacterium]|nr:hypothetical protein [Verrucomicrobiota bacterium]